MKLELPSPYFILAAFAMFAFIAAWWLLGAWIMWPYVKALRAGVPLRISEVIGMRLRRVPINDVVKSASLTRGLPGAPSLSQLETNALMNLDVVEMAQAFAEMRKIGLQGDWERLQYLSLCGYDTYAAVQARVDLDRLAREGGDRYRKRSSR